MKVTIKYFGLVAEAAEKSEEILELHGAITASELKAQCLNGLAIADKDSVQIAVNQNLNDKIKKLHARKKAEHGVIRPSRRPQAKTHIHT